MKDLFKPNVEMLLNKQATQLSLTNRAMHLCSMQ